MSSHLLIRLQSYQTAENSSTSEQYVYFSFSFGLDNFYFSSCVDMDKPMPITLNDHIIIPLQNKDQEDGTQLQLPHFIDLQRWQSHMIMFVHSIDISQLKTRVSIRKRYETRSGEILGFMITILNQGEIQFGNKYIQSISQHYLTIDNFKLIKNEQKKRSNGDQLSYFLIKSSSCQYAMPIMDGQVCIKLPETLQFMHVLGNVLISKSKLYTSDQLREKSLKITLNAQTNGYREQLQVNLQWGINLQQEKPQNTLLLDAHEILLYDIQLKLQKTQEITNGKLKLIYGNKAFQMHNFEGNATKSIKIKKIAFFMIKSQDEQFHIILQKNSKILSLVKIFTQDISMFGVMNLRRKFSRNVVNGNSIGSIKFKCEKGKNLSVPNNNKYWRECLNLKKKINMTSFLLSFQQLSIKNRVHQTVNLCIKSQTEQRLLCNVPNFQFFNPDQQVSYVPEIFTVRQQESVYIIMKPIDNSQFVQQENDQQFLGIALLNFNELRLGINSVEVPFFLNHKIVGILHCLINKIVPFTFIKSTFQGQVSQVNRYAHKTIVMAIKMGTVKFNQYYYTYQYDNKNQLYCIVQLNRTKKVLIMKNQENRFLRYGDSQLYFVASANSDNLNFVIDQTQHIKVKITFLISDLGREEEIYGSATVKIKAYDLFPDSNVEKVSKEEMRNRTKSNVNMHMNTDGHLQFTRIQLTNNYGTNVGQISFTVQKGAISPNNKQESIRQKAQYNSRTPQPQPPIQYKYQPHPIIEQKSTSGPFKSEIKRIQNDIAVVNRKMEVIQHQSPPLHVNNSPKHNNISANRYENNQYDLPKRAKNFESSLKPKAQRNLSVNPIRNAILNHSIDIRKDVRYDNSIDYGRNNRQNSERKSVKLPSLSVKDPNKNSLQDLIRLMQIRKRGKKGNYQHEDTLRDNQAKRSQRKNKLQSREISKQLNKIDKIERQNPNMERNMEILFSTKNTKKSKKPQTKKVNSQYDELQGLKSVLDEIKDIDQIEPEKNEHQIRQRPRDTEQSHNQPIKQKYQEKYQQKYQQKYQREPINLASQQFQDNQFATDIRI